MEQINKSNQLDNQLKDGFQEFVEEEIRYTIKDDLNNQYDHLDPNEKEQVIQMEIAMTYTWDIYDIIMVIRNKMTGLFEKDRYKPLGLKFDLSRYHHDKTKPLSNLTSNHYLLLEEEFQHLKTMDNDLNVYFDANSDTTVIELPRVRHAMYLKYLLNFDYTTGEIPAAYEDFLENELQDTDYLLSVHGTYI